MMKGNEAEIIEGIVRIADRHFAIANGLMDVVNKCRLKQSTEGIDEMVAYAFNSQGIDPQYAGGGGLGAGRHPVTITKTDAKPTKDNTGGYIEFTLTAFDGPQKGMSITDRLNVHNTNPVAVEIANKQMAAYCAVTGVFHFQNTDELMNKPFIIDVVPQKGNPQYTEVGALFDMNGNEPGKAGAGPMTGGQPQGAPPAGFGATGAPPANGGFGQPQGGQPQGGQPQGGGFGQPPADQGQPQGAPGGGQPGWAGGGAPQGGQPQGGAPQGGGWQQGGGAQQPGWGAR
jgi:hypothetical protein